MFFILLLAFTVVPVVEISLLFEVGNQIGGWTTLWIVLVTGVVGASLARSQGLAVLNQVQRELAHGAMPTQIVFEGFLIFAGGLLLLTPGFVTDILGLSMVIPGSRYLLGLVLQRWMKNKIKMGQMHVHTNMDHFDRHNDIRDAEVIDVEVIPCDKRHENSK